VTAPALIGLLDGILGDLATVSDGPPRVLPVVHDALEPDRTVLEMVIARYGGVLLRADLVGEAVVGNPPSELIEVVRTTSERFGLTIEVDVVDGIVSVRSTEGGVPNPPFAALLRVCELLLSDAARQHDLVALSFPTQGLEDRRLGLLWALTVQQVPPHLPSSVRALVPIWEGNVDVRLHCGVVPSMRYAIQSGRFIRRLGSEVALDAAIARILRTKDEPLVLFLGAGFSRSARLPLGDAVRDDALADLLGRPPGSDGLHEAFRRWAIDQGRLMEGEDQLSAEQFSAQLTLERVLREEFHNLREENRVRGESSTIRRLQEDCHEALDWVPPARESIRRLAACLPRLVILTVNFDQLVETDLGAPPTVFVAPDDFGAGCDAVAQRLRDGGGPLPVIKFHGDIDRPETIVADIDQTRFGLPPDAVRLLDTILDEGGRPITWIWVGCSMRDRDLNEWTRQQHGQRDVFEWWVDPLPGPSIGAFWSSFRRKDQDERDIDFERQRLLPETADNFLEALANAADA
jgi:hypothetical protein